RKEVGEMRDAVKERVKLDVAFDPMAEARKQITGAIRGAAKPSKAEGAPTASFETRPSAAPQDEDSGLPVGEQVDSSKKAAT
ncbi:MAG: preprotein translocase subunit TatA, partial [Methylocystis sp.]|nr:preprotein translocase subunit TatA [Methylocystis sp.]